MGENSAIEWTRHTFNPWIGCQKVSPGCDNCYAEALMDKRYGKVQWGPHGERKRTSAANWKKPAQWNRAAKAAGERHRVFCASLADWLDNQVSQTWRDDLADQIDATPNLIWLLLSKRYENFDKLAMWHHDDIPANVWIGFTAEDQPHFDRRWAIVQHIKAPVTFCSYEPALGGLRLPLNGSPLPDWIICGGESGAGRRPFNVQWARDLRDDCRVTGTHFFMKQIDKVQPIPADLMIREFPN